MQEAGTSTRAPTTDPWVDDHIDKFQEVRISFVYHEANSIADALAKRGSALSIADRSNVSSLSNSDQVWPVLLAWDSCPTLLLPFLASDLCTHRTRLVSNALRIVTSTCTSEYMSTTCELLLHVFNFNKDKLIF